MLAPAGGQRAGARPDRAIPSARATILAAATVELTTKGLKGARVERHPPAGPAPTSE
jgi:hypothetical protein